MASSAHSPSWEPAYSRLPLDHVLNLEPALGASPQNHPRHTLLSRFGDNLSGVNGTVLAPATSVGLREKPGIALVTSDTNPGPSDRPHESHYRNATDYLAPTLPFAPLILGPADSNASASNLTEKRGGFGGDTRALSSVLSQNTTNNSDVLLVHTQRAPLLTHDFRICKKAAQIKAQL